MRTSLKNSFFFVEGSHLYVGSPVLPLIEVHLHTIRWMGAASRGKIPSFSSASIFKSKHIFCLKSQSALLRVDTILKGLSRQEKETGNYTSCFPYEKKKEKKHTHTHTQEHCVCKTQLMPPCPTPVLPLAPFPSGVSQYIHLKLKASVWNGKVSNLVILSKTIFLLQKVTCTSSICW